MTREEKLVSAHLAQFISEHKLQGIEKVLDQRTRHVTVILEDIFQSQNASAVVRTCECMGLQEIHIVENISKYSVNPRVLKGSHKWLDIVHHTGAKEDNTVACARELKAQGYKILAADPDEDGLSVHDVDATQDKVALLFGNELRGVSQQALSLCDAKIRIPMYGFTESFNISVSVAICLSSIVSKLHQSGKTFGLSPDEKDLIRLQWYRKIVRKSALIEREFLRTIE